MMEEKLPWDIDPNVGIPEVPEPVDIDAALDELGAWNPDPKNQIIQEGRLNVGTIYTDTKIIQPLRVQWQPKPDITTFELAQCLQYMNRTIMPWEISDNMVFMRHFEIFNPNI